MGNGVSVHWNLEKLGRFCARAPETVSVIDEVITSVAAAASSMSAGNPTGYYHRNHQSPAVGGTTPRYYSDTHVYRYSAVGIVATDNYAAQKDNKQNNTLLKALG